MALVDGTTGGVRVVVPVGVSSAAPLSVTVLAPSFGVRKYSSPNVLTPTPPPVALTNRLHPSAALHKPAVADVTAMRVPASVISSGSKPARLTMPRSDGAAEPPGEAKDIVSLASEIVPSSPKATVLPNETPRFIATE